jgi:hypothetical protein
MYACVALTSLALARTGASASASSAIIIARLTMSDTLPSSCAALAASAAARPAKTGEMRSPALSSGARRR